MPRAEEYKISEDKHEIPHYLPGIFYQIDLNIEPMDESIFDLEMDNPILPVNVNDEYESFCNINLSKIGDPMRKTCLNLTVIDQPSGHYLPLERKHELSEAISSWVKLNGLN